MENKAKILILGALIILPVFFSIPAVSVYAAVSSPAVSTRSPDYITDAVATAKADVNPNGHNTNVWFEWTYDPNHFDYGGKTSPQSVGSGQASITVFADIKPLTSDRLYYYRAVVGGNDTTVYGSTITFRTKSSGSFTNQNSSGAPYISTGGNQNIDQTSATIKAEVNPKGLNTSVWFEWGLAAEGLIKQTQVQFIGNGSVSMNVLAGLSFLSPDTVYFFRPVARNDNGVVYGSTFNFRTIKGGAASNFIYNIPSILPAVSTSQARGVDSDSIAVGASVNPSGSNTQVWFEWGLAAEGLIKQTPRQSAGQGKAAVSILAELDSLPASQIYYYRAVAESAAGIVYGSTLSFATKPLSQPAASSTIAGSVKTGGLLSAAAFLSGGLVFWSLMVFMVLVLAICSYTLYTRRKIYSLLKP